VKHLVLALLLLASASSAEGAIAYVQSATATVTTATSITSGSINTTTGNGVIIFLPWSNFNYGFVSIVDNNSNSFTQAGSEVFSANFAAIRAYYNCNIAGRSGHTFTFTIGGADSLDIVIHEVSGQSTTSCLDQVTQAIDNTTSHSSGNITTTQANEILLGAASTVDANAMTQTGTFTQVYNVTATGSVIGYLTGYRIVSATGTYAYTHTTPGANRTAQSIVSIKEATAVTRRQKCIGCGADKVLVE